MVGTWLPDPPIGHRSPDEISRMPVPPVFLVDSDDDQDVLTGENAIENDGYQLLGDNDNQPYWDTLEEDTAVGTEVELLQEEQITTNQSHALNDIEHHARADLPGCSRTNSIEDMDSSQVNNTSRDISVDYDQVRAAMASITLPPSAIPSWASTIPDSEWGSFLQNRIRILQDQDNQFPESKNRSDKD